MVLLFTYLFWKGTLMSEVLYRPTFYFSTEPKSLAPVQWWIDEGTRVNVDGEPMVRVRNLIFTEEGGRWFESKEEALASVANAVREYAAKLVEKAAEIETCEPTVVA